jgi:hypothetical protein
MLRSCRSRASAVAAATSAAASTDEPLRFYIGSSDRPVQEEYYSWWGILGIRYAF